jgi:hypothetical protein
MASKKKSFGYVSEVLCEAHAHSAQHPPKHIVKHHSELGPDEEIECEVCVTMFMRRFGAL